MSSDLQNERSPEQQEAEIRHRLQSLGYPWQIVKVYTDRAKSGRLQRNRPDYQRMMDDIRSGAVVTDLILVDTLERLGRLDDMPTIRKELRDRHGVLVLTADSGFADPTTPQGRALGMVEAFRSTEDGRIKAYNVLRGEREQDQGGISGRFCANWLRISKKVPSKSLIA
jgi:DNA invertase Pin-like site-specific DNA recombinase